MSPVRPPGATGTFRPRAGRSLRLRGAADGTTVGTLALLLALSALSATARPADGQVGVDREIVELEFEGNHVFEDGELAQAISTDRTRCRTFVFKFLFPFCPLTNWGFAHDRAFLDEGTLPRDLLRLRLFYRRRGYRDARVDTVIARTDGRARVRFTIEEGPPTRVASLAIRGLDGTLDSAAVRRDFPLRVGEPFDLTALDRGKQEIIRLLRDRGHFDAAVLDEYFLPADGRTAEVGLDVRPGPRARIGAIRVAGDEPVGERIVRRRLAFSEGEFYRGSRIQQSQRDLFRLEAIRFANIEILSRPEVDTIVDVRVDVTPADRRAVRAGGGVTTTDCVRTETEFTHRNFLGSARRLRLTAGLSNLLADEVGASFPCTDVGDDDVFRKVGFELRADFEQPFFFSRRNSFRGSVFFERETVPDLFVRNSRGGVLSVTRDLGRRTDVTVSFGPELTSFDEQSADVFFCISFGFCQPEDIDQLTDLLWLNPLALSWSTDRTNASFSPTAGFRYTVQLETAGRFSGSDYQYVRFNAEAADFEEIAPGLVLATRVRGGFVEPFGDQPFDRPGADPRDEVVHPRKRFFVGGARSVRGFGQNLLGPRVLVLDVEDECAGFDGRLAECARTLAASAENPDDFFDERPVGGNAGYEASLELRKSLGDTWSVVSFLDVGQVLPDVTELDAPVLTPGIGVRFASPLGPLRLDIGYNPTDAARLPVVAELPNDDLVELNEFVEFDPFGFDDPGKLTEFVRRLKLQLSVGEAF